MLPHKLYITVRSLYFDTFQCTIKGQVIYEAPAIKKETSGVGSVYANETDQDYAGQCHDIPLIGNSYMMMTKSLSENLGFYIDEGQLL